ncbi:hypothetical protein EUREKA_104 [Mycobacterium phage Eureka]|uniref:Uncharacterized protein n=1 Tax=Mycobacterium phage Eureka TaxID=2922993 RepID=G1JWX4_9CAUD|nr:hypothetical protein BRUIN_102 [Mycobacterium phage Bruin]YP_009197770.1 HTH DNA binding protein [Mycobacterium phage NelitzaMV]YP_009591644.1 hypothetical protein FDG60_gp104 [Mycobacterium phage Eureka]AOY11959.1 HTH DNA binding protein [Mycobacterium phage Goldilocks]ATN91710.1 helix-turn-helix DNA binding domain protein [Mycobacterium phage Sassay]AYQ99093.1 helix-turn-helix DNA binding protein [Mycobacterium phage BaboJay]AYQ99787.1 helix-turn-helix DNA binding protein [Mycobacterium 
MELLRCEPLSGWHSRYRRIIDIYRSNLQLENAELCRIVDYQMEEIGEGWVCDDSPLPPLDTLMSAAEIGKRFGFARWDVTNWVKSGKIKRHETEEGPRYRLGDVVAYFSSR